MLLPVLMLTGINFVSAAYYGSYTRFSISDLLNEIDSETMILGAIFVVSFALLNFSLSKFFKDKDGEPNKRIAGIIAFVISLFITWGINKTGIDFEGFFYEIGFSEDLLFTTLPIILIGAMIVLILKYKLPRVLTGVGALLTILSFTPFIYAKGIVLAIGLICLGIGGYLLWRKKPKNDYSRYGPY